jgi:hypothetical protein
MPALAVADSSQNYFSGNGSISSDASIGLIVLVVVAVVLIVVLLVLSTLLFQQSRNRHLKFVEERA